MISLAFLGGLISNSRSDTDRRLGRVIEPLRATALIVSVKLLIAGLCHQLTILVDLGAYGGQQVTHHSGIDTNLERT